MVLLAEEGHFVVCSNKLQYSIVEQFIVHSLCSCEVALPNSFTTWLAISTVAYKAVKLISFYLLLAPSTGLLDATIASHIK